jgi:release factor glutamine methyltransferase
MPETQAIADVLPAATELLADAGISDPRREAGSLLALALAKDQTFLIAHPEYRLTGDEQKLFDEYLRRRATREPFQYIAGRQEFYGLDFIVTPDVLIPRPETELLVEEALKLFGADESVFFCEIGAGSGCISVSILYHLKRARAVGLDISQKALDVAEKNAYQNNVAERLELGVSDVFSHMFSGADGSLQFDLIVSNPPYIPAADFKTLQAEVRDHEPPLALTDNENGLSIIERIINESPNFLKPGGWLLMEIGFGQSSAVREMTDMKIWESIDFLPDLQGIPRIVKLKKRN